MRVCLSPIYEWDEILHSLNNSTNIVFHFFTPYFGWVRVYAPSHSNNATIRRSFLYASSKFVFSSLSLLHSAVVVFYDNLLFFALRSTYRSLLYSKYVYDENLIRRNRKLYCFCVAHCCALKVKIVAILDVDYA